MRVLVACEESQAVCKEMRRLGHEAYSCDIEPCSGGHPEWHIQCDVRKLLNFISFVQDCKQRFQVSDAYCDSAEQTLIQGLKTACAKAGVPINIHNARKGEINDRIRFFCRLQAMHRHKFMPECTHTLEAFRTAVWDAKYITKDVRLDDGTYNVDSLDAQEYAHQCGRRPRV